jgi:hypothetical protein
VPVPVRRSDFVALHRRHAPLNVEVDLGAIAAFSATSRRVPPEDLLYCDLQAGPDAPRFHRLGSGRSGFYRGWYLKGIGRTPLAGNWNLPGERVHNSGFLLPSAAIREWVASEYLAAVGAAGSIVPCEGLLVRPLPRALRGFSALAFGPRRQPAPVDERFQAISIKRAGFARLSNVSWLLGNLTGAPGLSPADFFALLAAALGDSEAAAGPEPLAAALEAAFLQTLAHFRTHFSRGVYWCSFANNFTLDGRFLDLELPVLLGSPFFGALSKERGRTAEFRPARSVAVGLEGLHAVRGFKSFLVQLFSTLSGLLAGDCLRSACEASFARDLSRLLEKWLSRRDGVFRSQARRRALVEATVAAEWELSRGQRAVLRRILAALLPDADRPAPELPAMRRLDFLSGRPARPEIFFEPALYAFDGLDLPAPDPARCELLNSEVASLDELAGLDGLLAALKSSPSRLRAGLAPLKPAPPPCPRTRPAAG